MRRGKSSQSATAETALSTMRIICNGSNSYCTPKRTTPNPWATGEKSQALRHGYARQQSSPSHRTDGCCRTPVPYPDANKQHPCGATCQSRRSADARRVRRLTYARVGIVPNAHAPSGPARFLSCAAECAGAAAGGSALPAPASGASDQPASAIHAPLAFFYTARLLRSTRPPNTPIAVASVRNSRGRRARALA